MSGAWNVAYQERGKIVQNENGQYFYVCSVCQFEFITPESFREHQVAFHSAMMKTPNQKAKTSRSMITRNITAGLKHREKNSAFRWNEQHQREKRSIKYKGCSAKFSSHEAIRKRRNSLEFSCDYCVLKFISTNGLRLHIRQSHKSKLSFVCDACPRSFNRSDELASHTRKHVNKRLQLIQCNFCNRHLLSIYHLDIHIKRSRSAGKYQCKLCKYKAALRKHGSTEH